MAIDFAFRDGDGRVHVLDWKTGKERGVDHLQVGTYALYARTKWGASAEGVLGGLVYLVGNGAGAAGERVEVKLDEEALRRCEEEMRGSIGAMRAVLRDPARNVADAEAFPQLEDRERCRRCPYRRPCGRL
jgi:CRISPR/Cas system-associated exonuclease Cas4 (RecB family)